MGIAVILTIASMIDYLVKAKDILAYREAEVPELEKVQSTTEDADSLAAAVLEAADSRNLKIGCAESCTGGLIAATITDVPGASKHFEGGIVSYTESVKHARLDVSWDTLKEHGVVSEQTACEMAKGACQALDVDVAVSVTGIAGPGGAEPGKPVGTVWIGVSSARATYAKHFLFDGGRDDVRRQTVETALAMMLSEIEETGAA
jgi:nicotinamide-nucleotide amidase